MLVIDDDRIVTTVFKAHLQSFFPDAQIDAVNQPTAVPSYDVYFIDNDFDGTHMACDLIKDIRQVEPQALIVALSRTVNLDTLQRLMNLGCNAIYSKQDPVQSEEAREVIANYLSIIAKQKAEPERRNAFSTTISSLFDLLAEWNKRLAVDLSKESKPNR